MHLGNAMRGDRGTSRAGGPHVSPDNEEEEKDKEEERWGSWTR